MSELLTHIGEEQEDISEIAAFEQEIHKLWNTMREVRFSNDLPRESRDLELLRLMEVQDRLDIEWQRLHEQYMKNFVESLKLEEINAVAYLQGGTKCRVDQKVIGRKGRSISLNVKGVLENRESFPGFANIRKLTPQTAKDIADMQSRRSEMIDTLVMIERKKNKSPEDIERLNQINDMLKMQKERIRGV